ncbi:hypothetical protein HPB51_017697 [Rhipicephalus microplus]|uniref:Transposable element n=1 Tax=Rhipicephalus microplus TaxID=6941 RepID=A0A9J6E205_RHIMP|nr:hypothetical protein HPB51_017697 [Rhipicephalus microplus]
MSVCLTGMMGSGSPPPTEMAESRLRTLGLTESLSPAVTMQSEQRKPKRTKQGTCNGRGMVDVTQSCTTFCGEDEHQQAVTGRLKGNVVIVFHDSGCNTVVVKRSLVPDSKPTEVDLKPIENVWGLVKCRLVARNLGSSTKETLFAAIQEEWEALHSLPEIVAALYNLMPSRVALVTAADVRLN